MPRCHEIYFLLFMKDNMPLRLDHLNETYCEINYIFSLYFLVDILPFLSNIELQKKQQMYGFFAHMSFIMK